MIVFFGIFDLLTVLLSVSCIYFSVYRNAALLVLALLGVKGLWTISTTGNIADPLALVDIVTAVAVFITLQFGLFHDFSMLMLAALSLKSIISLKPF